MHGAEREQERYHPVSTLRILAIGLFPNESRDVFDGLCLFAEQQRSPNVVRKGGGRDGGVDAVRLHESLSTPLENESALEAGGDPTLDAAIEDLPGIQSKRETATRWIAR